MFSPKWEPKFNDFIDECKKLRGKATPGTTSFNMVQSAIDLFNYLTKNTIAFSRVFSLKSNLEEPVKLIDGGRNTFTPFPYDDVSCELAQLYLDTFPKSTQVEEALNESARGLLGYLSKTAKDFVGEMRSHLAGDIAFHKQLSSHYFKRNISEFYNAMMRVDAQGNSNYKFDEISYQLKVKELIKEINKLPVYALYYKGYDKLKAPQLLEGKKLKLRACRGPTIDFILSKEIELNRFLAKQGLKDAQQTAVRNAFEKSNEEPNNNINTNLKRVVQEFSKDVDTYCEGSKTEYKKAILRSARTNLRKYAQSNKSPEEKIFSCLQVIQDHILENNTECMKHKTLWIIPANPGQTLKILLKTQQAFFGLLNMLPTKSLANEIGSSYNSKEVANTLKKEQEKSLASRLKPYLYPILFGTIGGVLLATFGGLGAALSQTFGASSGWMSIAAFSAVIIASAIVGAMLIFAMSRLMKNFIMEINNEDAEGFEGLENKIKMSRFLTYFDPLFFGAIIGTVLATFGGLGTALAETFGATTTLTTAASFGAVILLSAIIGAGLIFAILNLMKRTLKSMGTNNVEDALKHEEQLNGKTHFEANHNTSSKAFTPMKNRMSQENATNNKRSALENTPAEIKFKNNPYI